MPSLAEILGPESINKLREMGRKGDLLKEAGGSNELAEVIEEIRSEGRLPMVPPSKPTGSGISQRVMAQKGVNRRG